MAPRRASCPEHDAIAALIRGLHAERDSMPSSHRDTYDGPIVALFAALAAVDACRYTVRRTDRHVQIVDRWAPGRGILVEREFLILRESGVVTATRLAQADADHLNKRNAADRATELRADLDMADR
jgi:hypothetical protein